MISESDVFAPSWLSGPTIAHLMEQNPHMEMACRVTCRLWSLFVRLCSWLMEARYLGARKYKVKAHLLLDSHMRSDI
jgi:hypothetical protein